MTSAELSGSSVTWNLTTIFSLCFRTDALTVKSRGQRLYFRNSKRTWNILLNEMGCPSERVDKRGWKSLNLSTSEQGSACHLKDFESKKERSSVPVCRVLSCCIFSQTVPPDLLVFNAGSQMQCLILQDWTHMNSTLIHMNSTLNSALSAFRSLGNASV